MYSTEWDMINNLNAIPVDENLIIEYLLHRLEEGITYTWIGKILLSLNPEKNISHNSHYFPKFDDFFNFPEILQKNIKPHIFTVAASAHYKLLNNLGRPSQVILISGDSGAGKTFNANQAINFLVAINKSSSTCSLGGKKVEKFVGKIVNACPLITAFSTASTAKNVRSSRQGQLIRFEYENGIVSGASIQSFLLERTRVTKGSNNFMIFYQLLSGLSDSELENFGLSKRKSYNLLGSNLSIQQEELSQNFQETCKAMQAVGFSENERSDILKIIALLIHLGNIHFIQTGDGSTAVDLEKEASRKAIEKASDLIGVPKDNLNELFTTTLISTQSKWRRHTIYRRNLSSTEICRNRLFSIIRHLYDNLFHWLIDRINQTLSSGGEHHSWLGVLDIFGFEAFSVNGIEELSINYANERLQLYFVQECLESEHRELLEEGLSDLPPPGIIDIYRDRLNAIEVNLFTILNDASQHSIQYHLLQLKKQLLKPENRDAIKFSPKDEAFVINHYSQPVEYSLQDLLSKNSDKVPSELVSAFTESSNSLLKCLSATNEDHFLNNSNKIYARKGTTLAKVKRSLDALLKELNKCDTHYVRCIKPRFIESFWDRNELKKQLIYTGILDVLRISRCKFSIRLRYDEFNNRYSKKNFAGKNIPSLDLASNFQRCKCILTEITDEQTKSSMVYFGKRLIFLQESFFYTLENQRKEYRNQCVIKIQKYWRNYHLQKVTDLNKCPEDSSSKDRDIKNHALLSIDNKKWSDIVSQTEITAEINESPKLQLSQSIVKLNQDEHINSISFVQKTFFYKNRILSRQRQAEIPVRFHTRLTCLPYSHRLPKSELPRGLEDCL